LCLDTSSDGTTNSSQSVTLPQFRQFLHNKPIDVRYYVLLLGTILSENITYFCSIVAFLNEVVIIDIKFNLRNKMGLKRMFRWLLLAVMPLFLFTGCGDLEPDMQDTRTVILNMDFHGKSSSRSSSSVSASELSQYNTHLILALPSREYLTSSYKNYYSSFAQGLMNTADKKVSLEIPLNTQMKIFAFLFEENYSMSELFPGTREVGYYGESQTFSIGTQTNNLSLSITLIQVPGTGTDTGGDTETGGGSTDTTPPVIAEVTPITTPTTNTTPYYTFSSSEAGTITYGGSCATAGSATTNAIVGHNLIIFNTLSSGTYSDCTITVTDSAGNASNAIAITAFTVYITWSGSHQLGTSGSDLANGVATDSSGNVYVTGKTKGGLDGCKSAGVEDLFVVKYNSSGTKQWTNQLGSSSRDSANDVATDSSGNIYVTGTTYWELDGNTSAGKADLFVVKYNSSGTWQWTKQNGTDRYDEARGVATDSSGNVYVTGYTEGGLDGNTSAGNADLFVVKYNSSGSKQWTNQLGTSSTDTANGVATDSSGNVYVAGGTYGGLDGNTGSGVNDLFVVKYNSSGTKQWTKQLGTSSNDRAHGVATDSSGNVYVTGYTAGGLDGNTIAGFFDLFVVKYNSSGTKQWTNQLGSSRILHSQTPSK